MVLQTSEMEMLSFILVPWKQSARTVLGKAKSEKLIFDFSSWILWTMKLFSISYSGVFVYVLYTLVISLYR